MNTVHSNRYVFKSNVAIDINADVTGLFLSNYEDGELPTSLNSTSACIVAPKSDADLILSSSDRFVRRHHRRSKNRLKMAKRLMNLCVVHYLEKAPTQLSKETQKSILRTVHGLMNRRGYNRVESELDLTLLEEIDGHVFACYPSLQSFFHDGQLASQYEEIITNEQGVLSFCKAIPSDREFRIYLKSQFKELSDEHRSYLEALRLMREDSSAISMQLNTGHQSRLSYLEGILQDMANCKRLAPLVTAVGSLERLWCLIGNINNLQLRALRWYFQDKDMANGDILKLGKLQQILVRAFKYFHPTSVEEKERLDRLILILTQSDDILETLCSIKPTDTIAPYEDQNNRKPPVDQTLLLSPSSLTKRYGNRWRIWSKNFLKADPSLGYLLDQVLQYPDRHSRVFGKEKFEDSVYRDSYVLQRVLDRSSAHDPYMIRKRTKNTGGHSIDKAERWTNMVLGSQHVKDFLSFAKDYYQECDAARNGLWFQEADNLLERSNLHPPLKKNILTLLVGNVFGLDGTFGAEFIQSIWPSPVSPRSRSTVRSVCASIAKVRDQLGSSFHWRYRQVRQQLKRNEAISKDDLDLKKVVQSVEKVIDYLSKTDHFNEEILSRISNPYSLSQLYDLIETERSGFSSCVLAVHTENLWRSSLQYSDSNKKMAANAIRLTSDSVRPFDGVMAKFLTRNAHEIANIVVKELKLKCTQPGADIDLSFLIRQNKYRFSASLAKMKGNNASAKKFTEASKKQESRWLQAQLRVIDTSCGLCPYTGQELKETDIDHIIAWDLLDGEMSNLFNQEVNLILCSKEGKQKKGGLRYRLNDLHPNYLFEVFGTDNIEDIEQGIERELASLENVKRLSRFDLLSDFEQVCVRHALFLEDYSPARRNVLRYLSRSDKIQLEGTQAWFVRTLITLIKERLKQWCEDNNHQLHWHSFYCSARISNNISHKLAELDDRFVFNDVTSLTEYATNALCAFAAGCGYRSIVKTTGAFSGLADVEDENNAKMLADLLPQNIDVVHVKATDSCNKKDIFSKQVFKDSILGERFLPIITRGGQIFVGYSSPNKEGECKNSILVEGKNPEQFLNDINFVLEKSYEPSIIDELKAYKIDKQKAFAYFNEVILKQEQATAEELRLFELLNSLLYVVQRVSVYDKMIIDGKKFTKKEDVLKDKDFAIPVKYKGKDYAIAGQITMPDRLEWEQLINDDVLQPYWGEALENIDFDLQTWLRERFFRSDDNRQHKRYRTTASLAMRAKADGGFRIRRHTPDGKPIYQLYSINGAKYKGFAVDSNGKINWKKPVAFPELVNKSITPFDLTDVAGHEIVKMTDYRVVQNDKVKVEIAPGTKARRYVRITLPFDLFKHWIQAEPNAKDITSPTMLGTSMRLNNAKAFVRAAREDTPYIGEPQTFMIFTKVGEEITFKCTVASTASMNDAYGK